jgi:hypothetical protein
MIRALSKKLTSRNALKIRDTNKNIGRGHDLNSKPFEAALTQVTRFYILQGAKRLQTFSVPQEEEMYPLIRFRKPIDK